MGITNIAFIPLEHKSVRFLIDDLWHILIRNDDYSFSIKCSQIELENYDNIETGNAKITCPICINYLNLSKRKIKAKIATCNI